MPTNRAPRPRRTEVPIDSEERWRALGSPLRQRLIELLENRRSWTARALAEGLGRDARSLYPHLELLCRVGLVSAVTGASFTEYRLVGTPVLVGHRAGEPFAGHYRKTIQRMMGEAGRIHGRPAPGSPAAQQRITQSWTLNLTEAQAHKLARAARRFEHAVREALLDLGSEKELSGERQPHHVVLALAAFDPRVRGRGRTT